MKAIGYQKSLAIDQPEALQDIELADPVCDGHDLLVEVKAVSVNPVDTKVRKLVVPPAGEWKVLGWDAAGVVRAIGPEVTLFQPGDRVWYAGDLTRQGTNAELHLVDERIAGHMPKSLDFAQAAALPLTTITAWEMVFDRLRLSPGKRPTDETLLIIGAAGGVGSIMVQLVRRLTGVTVIGSASRPETQVWVRGMGAHHVIDHNRPLHEELQRIGLSEVSHIVCLNQTDQHFPQIAEAIAPQGKFGLIDDPETLDVTLLKRKSVSLHWEFMFTRSMFRTADRIGQHLLLNEVAELVDVGILRTTFGEHFGRIEAANLRRAHALIESGRAKGKIVLEGF
ncbi:zinc-binding alcohol dehydrogenase family protein [uncultured Desulfobulbus sp.]|uniref:zinc-binding alcohol dehydrogenase family protein n=1 Tax=uncultured Desulfobulbus sp. TaxID=239745 RepID=UPI0029C72F9A|nr:zinc-binding alcohol dehydrogenase family protein [uncultured Desulfobulbus sp.]